MNKGVILGRLSMAGQGQFGPDSMHINLDGLVKEDGSPPEFSDLAEATFGLVNLMAAEPEKNTGSCLTLRGNVMMLPEKLLSAVADYPQAVEIVLVDWLKAVLGKDVLKDVSVLDSNQQMTLDFEETEEFEETDGKLLIKTQFPPKSGQLILYVFLPKKTRDAVAGDLAEDFDEACKRFGPVVARRLYWWDVVRSLFPILVAFLVRVSKWVGLAAVGEILRHFVK